MQYQTLTNGTAVEFADDCPLINDWAQESTFTTRLWVADSWQSDTIVMSASTDAADLLPSNVGSGKWRTMVSNIVRDAMDEGWIVNLHISSHDLWHALTTCTVTLRAPGETIVQGITVATESDSELPVEDRRASIRFSWSDAEDRGRMLFDREDCHHEIWVLKGNHVSLSDRRLGEWKGDKKEAGWKNVQPLTLTSAPPVVSERLSERVSAASDASEAQSAYDPSEGLRPALRASLGNVIEREQAKRRAIADTLRETASRIAADGYISTTETANIRKRVQSSQRIEREVQAVLDVEGTLQGDGGQRRFITLEDAVTNTIMSAETAPQTVATLVRSLKNVNAELQVVL